MDVASLAGDIGTQGEAVKALKAAAAPKAEVDAAVAKLLALKQQVTALDPAHDLASAAASFFLDPIVDKKKKKAAPKAPAAADAAAGPSKNALKAAAKKECKAAKKAEHKTAVPAAPAAAAAAPAVVPPPAPPAAARTSSKKAAPATGPFPTWDNEESKGTSSYMRISEEIRPAGLGGSSSSSSSSSMREVVDLWPANAAMRAAAGCDLYEARSASEKAQIAMWQTFSIAAADLDAWDAWVAGRSYAVADRLTLADVSLCRALAGRIASSPAHAPSKRWLAQVEADLGLATTVCVPANVQGPVLAPVPSSKATKGGGGGPAAKAAAGGEATAAMSEKQAAKKAEKEAKKAEKKKKEDPPAAATGADDADPSAAALGAITALDVRVGKIVEVWAHPDAEKLFCEKIDLGDAELRTIASGLRAFYNEADLLNRKVLVFANLKPRTMQGFKSEGMVICASSADHTTVKLIEPPEAASPGERVSFGDLANVAAAAPSAVQKKKLLEKALPCLRTNADGVATCAGAIFKCEAGPCTAPLPSSAIG